MHCLKKNKDMNAIGKTGGVARYVVLDVAVVAVACLIPAVSHLTAVPLDRLNQMLALLLAGMLVGRDWRNGLVLAVLMPAVSCVVVGMPMAGKMVCMVAELATVAGLFHLLSRRWAVLPSVLVAALAGKVVYYALKAVVIAPAVLIGTAWWMQLGAVVLWGGLFALLYKRLK